MKTVHTLRKIALIGGIGYLIIFVTGIFANFFIIESLVIQDDAAATFMNIAGNLSQFRYGILSFIIMVVFDLILTWALYLLFKPVDSNQALITAWFRLVNCTIFGIALFNLFDVLELTGSSSYLSNISQEYLQTEVMRSLSSFNYTWLIGLLFFGFHLLILGGLTLKSKIVPKFIGYLLIIGGLGYLTDSFAQFLMPNYKDYKSLFAMFVIIPGVVGELSLTVWLLVKGGKK